MGGTYEGMRNPYNLAEKPQGKLSERTRRKKDNIKYILDK
jgi:hypothetical protein